MMNNRQSILIMGIKLHTIFTHVLEITRSMLKNIRLELVAIQNFESVKISPQSLSNYLLRPFEYYQNQITFV